VFWIEFLKLICSLRKPRVGSEQGREVWANSHNKRSFTQQGLPNVLTNKGRLGISFSGSRENYAYKQNIFQGPGMSVAFYFIAL